MLIGLTKSAARNDSYALALAEMIASLCATLGHDEAADGLLKNYQKRQRLIAKETWPMIQEDLREIYRSLEQPPEDDGSPPIRFEL